MATRAAASSVLDKNTTQILDQMFNATLKGAEKARAADHTAQSSQQSRSKQHLFGTIDIKSGETANGEALQQTIEHKSVLFSPGGDSSTQTKGQNQFHSSKKTRIELAST